MSTKLIKFFGFFKTKADAIIVLIAIVIAITGIIQHKRASRWEAKALRLDGKLAEQQADQDKLYGEAAVARAARNVVEAKEKRKRADLEARIQKFQKDTVIAKQVLKKEKEKTVTLPPTELVAQINERIGDESSLTGAGLFLFTRLGANNTLDRFKDGEFYLSEYNKFQGVLADHKTEVESFNTSIKECGESVATNLGGWNDCRETLATANKDIEAWKRTGKASVWRGRKQGVVWTIIIGGGLKLLGVW